jgi:RHS repeat-associated protein
VGSLGHPSEDETGLVYMRARYYDPAVGRFASEDPARDGGNWLAYCEGSPITQVDRSGTFGDLPNPMLVDWEKVQDGWKHLVFGLALLGKSNSNFGKLIIADLREMRFGNFANRAAGARYANAGLYGLIEGLAHVILGLSLIMEGMGLVDNGSPPSPSTLSNEPLKLPLK